MDLLKRVDIDTKTVSEDGDKAVVEVTVDVFQMFDDMLMSKLPQGIAFQSTDAKIEGIAQAVAASLNDLQKVGKTAFQINCTYDEANKMWLPEDSKGIGELLAAKILNIQ